MTRWVSTRDASGQGASFVEALFRGLAPDGGLYVPRDLDALAPADAAATLRESGSFQETALRVGLHLLPGDVPPSVLEAAVEEALDLPVPLVALTAPAPGGGGDASSSAGSGRLGVLELFHGPSLAFKDLGARFMAALMTRLDPDPDPARPRTVLVATSGDTGGAVARAFHGREGFRVVVLFPRGGVSEVQRRLFTTLGDNVLSLAVRGDFDDCQRMVKEAFAVEAADASRGAELRLTSANSINVGRLVPQTFYYAAALRLLGEEAPDAAGVEGAGGAEGGAVFSVPSGNLGNLTAGMIARRLGFPVRGLVAATNENDAFRRWLEVGDTAHRPAVSTVSNAMDVARPSNLERIRWLVDDDRAALGGEVASYAFDDAATLECIARYDETGYLLDPHGAVAVLGAEAWLRDHGSARPVVALATAHPAKFPRVVRRAVGREPPVPGRLGAALAGEERSEEVEPTVDALMEVVLDGRRGRR